MNRTWSRYFRLTLLFAIGACRGDHTTSNRQIGTRNGPPNIVFLLTDDQAADTLSGWGSKTIRTPNMDRLVDGGTSFRRAYCQGSWHGAVCVPSRAMLLSGRRLGRVNPGIEGFPTLPEQLRSSGYRTFATGKWHNGKASMKRMFDEGRSIHFGGMCDHEQVALHDWSGDELLDRGIGDDFSSTLFADAAISFIEGQDTDEPFFCWAAFTAPHDPRQPRREWLDNTLRAAGDLPPNFMPQHPFDNGALVIRDEALCPWPRPRDLVRDSRRAYAAMIEHLDHEIGRILDAIERRGDVDNTIVVLASDHGLALGSHGLLGKQSLYEHSQRAVCVLMGPGIPAAESREALVYLYDVAPTLLQLAGVPALEGLDGRSLVPVLNDASAPLRDGLFTRYETGQRAWTESRWKLIRYPKIGKSQLFDLEGDPHELQDLAGQPEHAAQLARLEERLKRAQRRAGDDLPFSFETLMPEVVDLSGLSRKPDRWQPRYIVEKYFR